jgi:hypothetical protein
MGTNQRALLSSAGVLLMLGACSTAAPQASSPQAIAPRVAPTIEVVARTVTVVSNSIALSPISITDVRVSAQDTTVDIRNTGRSSVNLERWTLLLGPNIALSLRPIELGPGQARKLHMSYGADTPQDVYLGGSSGGIALTFSPGQRAVLIGPEDQVASVYRT